MSRLGTVEKIEFCERYVGLMSDYDLAQELNTSIQAIREIKREFMQKCWTCRNACNSNNCLWVKNQIYPNYETISKDGHINRCERYEEDVKGVKR